MKLANDQDDTVRYFPCQIHNDVSHVCGEYSVLFLHNIARSPDPWLNAYEFWTGNQDAFFLLPTNRGGVAPDNNETCVACCTTDKTTKENKPSLHGDKILNIRRIDYYKMTCLYEIFFLNYIRYTYHHHKYK